RSRAHGKRDRVQNVVCLSDDAPREIERPTELVHVGIRQAGPLRVLDGEASHYSALIVLRHGFLRSRIGLERRLRGSSLSSHSRADSCSTSPRTLVASSK